MTNNNVNNYVIGVDVGGTKVAAGSVNGVGEFGAATRVPMVSDDQADDGLTAVTGAIDYLFEMGREQHWMIRAIGICAPGPLDPKTGVVINPPSMLAKLSVSRRNLAALPPACKN